MSPELPAKSSEGEALRLAGWDVLWAGDAVEAFVAVKSRNLDLVVLHYPVDEAIDMDLPNVLRGVAPAGYLPIMIVAADAADPLRCQYLDSGADDVVSGRTSASEMVARVRALLRIKRLHDELADSRRALQQSMKREQKLLAKLRRDNAQLQKLCTTDPLTHVQNVRSFREILAHQFRIARRYRNSLTLMTMDVDHFKVINDSHGHPSGDYVLKEMAVILKRSVRESDVVARTGGDEFSILLPKADRTQASKFADRIRREVYVRKFEVYGQRIHATLSIGIASYPQDAEIIVPGMLIYFADQALLLAKEQGRDRFAAVRDIPRDARARLQMQYRHSTDEVESQLLAEEPAASQAE
jgi:diguanylate cyclase (GGDEF)-like protein